jgi:hypothetical protein
MGSLGPRQTRRLRRPGGAGVTLRARGFWRPVLPPARRPVSPFGPVVRRPGSSRVSLRARWSRRPGCSRVSLRARWPCRPGSTRVSLRTRRPRRPGCAGVTFRTRWPGRPRRSGGASVSLSTWRSSRPRRSGRPGWSGGALVSLRPRRSWWSLRARRPRSPSLVQEDEVLVHPAVVGSGNDPPVSVRAVEAGRDRGLGLGGYGDAHQGQRKRRTQRHGSPCSHRAPPPRARYSPANSRSQVDVMLHAARLCAFRSLRRSAVSL